MIKRLPLIPTIIVAAAAVVMVALGFWQIGRADEKAAMMAAYGDAAQNDALVSFPTNGDGKDLWFRRSKVECNRVLSIETVAGTSARGAKGWAQRARCVVGDHAVKREMTALVDLGYSRDLMTPQWDGGMVTGVIAPGPRLVADPAAAGLEALAKPDPNDLPNNHIAYAGQWFFFALTAIIIYWFAVRSRMARAKD